MGITLSIIGNFLNIAQKHIDKKIENNRPGLNQVARDLLTW